MIKRIFAILSAFLLTSVAASFQQFSAQGETEKPIFSPLERHRNEIADNPGGISAYKADVVQLLQSLVSQLGDDETVFSTITFTEPLSEAEVQQLISQYDLDVVYTLARTLDVDSLRGTLFVDTASSSELLNQEVIRQIEEGAGSRFVGIVELVAEVPSDKAIALNLESSVYLVDPSADSHLVQNPTNDYMPGLAWRLEEQTDIELNLGI